MLGSLQQGANRRDGEVKGWMEKVAIWVVRNREGGVTGKVGQVLVIGRVELWRNGEKGQGCVWGGGGLRVQLPLLWSGSH